jgi:uncharacterized protein involved in cysteine biosynthesis
MSRHITNARAAWGNDMPPWIAVLAESTDRLGLKAVATKVDYSIATITNTINCKYPGDMAKVERAVRGALMSATVECPILGTIPTNDCESHQRAEFSTSSPQAAKLARACPSCSQGGHYAE